MNQKSRIIIGILSIIFIIGMYVMKSSNLAGKSMSDILSISLTSIVVTMFKIGIICSLLMIAKKLIRK